MMTNEFEFLEEDGMENDAMLMVSTWGKELCTLKAEYELALAAMEDAKNRYEDFRCKFLPQQMSIRGIKGLQLDNGLSLDVVTKFHCTPNKNKEDREKMRIWLEEHNGGDLISEELKVSSIHADKLVEIGVPYEEEVNINTNSLKAWLKGELGHNGGVANIDISDIPSCVHFVELEECVIS
jgi:hypothetical protein